MQPCHNARMEWPLIILISISTLAIITTCIVVALRINNHLLIIQERQTQQDNQRVDIQQLLKDQQQEQQSQRQRFDEHQIKSLTLIQESLQKAMDEIRKQVNATLNQHTESLSKQFDKLTEQTQEKLKEISGEVDKQLSKGFEKTTATFTDVMKRLTIIDEAQKKITELSTNVVSLQEVLSDKRSRGAFGEVQLSALIRNVLPEQHFAFQHTLSNGNRVDCILFLPDPTGNIAIDSKFPLENYQQMTNPKLSSTEREDAAKQFKSDIQKHIKDIQSKYIIPGETSDGAMMFVPAEAIFAEIHAHYPELVETAQRARVWLVSPTTMMAILTTARAVLKDAATRNQVHIIQEHLIALSKDFGRFQSRMDKLKNHIKLAHEDADEVHTSSKKISSRFNKIEKVELPEYENSNTLLTLEQVED